MSFSLPRPRAPASAAAAPCGSGGGDAVVWFEGQWQLFILVTRSPCVHHVQSSNTRRRIHPHAAMSPSPTTLRPLTLHPSPPQTGRPTRRQCWFGVRGLEHEGSLGTHCGHHPSTSSLDSRQSSLLERQQHQQGHRYYPPQTTTRAIPSQHLRHHAPPCQHGRHGQRQQQQQQH